MSLVVVGLNHRTAPVEVLGRAAVSRHRLPSALVDLVKREHVAEAVILSTCNRTEIYARATKFHPCVAEMSEELATWSDLAPDDLGEYVYTFHDAAAATHLFSVAAGIDSLMLGEGEILGQVRQAWTIAEAEGAARQVLGGLFRHAVQTGKRARTETTIARGAVSISSAAVWLATERLGSLDDKNVLVLGAGKMGEGLAVALAGSGVHQVVVANRSPQRGQELAMRVGGPAVGLEDLPGRLIDADVLLTSTEAEEVLITRGMVEEAMAQRPGRPLLAVDIAVPRDVEPTADRVPAVTLLDMDDLKAFVNRNLDERRREVERVRAIVSEEVEHHRAEISARELAPLVTALRERGETIRAAELERVAARLADLDADERDAVEALTRGIVSKLLHEPTVRVKDAASDDNSLAEALSTLFDL